MIGWFLVLTHTLDRGVLLVSLDGDVRISERAALSQQFTDLVRMYLPRAVVMEIGASVVSAAALSTVLRAQRLCDQAGVPLAVVADGPVTRALLEAGTAGPGLRVLGRGPGAVTATA
ncbi:hypothetical protein ACFU9F_33455 [Streptomyces zhihengii]|uniref:STAS domain-containing protein n=1 Tax=Streptomyces zhihengii TaxID=1818004 RepID=A0ABS2UZU7_9ACTN|nr:hypothetical protein [Streptomyces zhihengii]MBM9623089.1 hypothetical protein [Streptomyces zhihengii]